MTRRTTRFLIGIAAVLAMSRGPAPEGARVTGPSDPKRAEMHRKLEERLARLVADLPGATGYFIRDLSGGEVFEKDADAVFVAASTIKLPVFLELLKRAQEGTIDLARPVPIDPRARVEGGGVLEKWPEPYPVLTARQLAVLMMDFSDNYATNILIDFVGMEHVDRRLRGWGLGETRLRRRMMDLEAARNGRENVTTPRDMGMLLDRLYRGEILDAAGTRLAIEVMSRNDRTPIKRGLPAGIEAADKEGELDGVRCDAGIVFVPGRAAGVAASQPFVVSVMTAYLRDDRAGETFIADVTGAAFDHFRIVARSTQLGRTLDETQAP
jgi:beta-lactamase class A